MEIRKWHVVDIFYNEEDKAEAAKAVKHYQRQGYSLEAQDSGTPFDNCDQLIKWFGNTLKGK